MISASTTKAPRMLRVAFNLDGARIVGLYHESLSSAAQRHDRVVVDRLAVDVIFNATRVREDLLFRPAARRQPSKAERGGHELEDVAAGWLVEHLRRARRKLLVEPLLELRRLIELVQTP